MRFLKQLIEITKEKSTVEKWLSVFTTVLAAMCCGMYVMSGIVVLAICWGMVSLLQAYNLILHT